MCSKLASGCWALYQPRPCVNSAALMMIYYSFIHSHLNCCINSWGGAAVATLDPLIKLQIKAIRIITRKNMRTHTKPLLSDLKLLTITDLYRFEVAKLFYRNHYKSLNLCNTETEKMVLDDDLHTYNPRRKLKCNYFLPRVQTTQAQSSIQFLGAKIWNQIPTEIRKMNFFKSKKELKILFLSQYSSN